MPGADPPAAAAAAPAAVVAARPGRPAAPVRMSTCASSTAASTPETRPMALPAMMPSTPSVLRPVPSARAPRHGAEHSAALVFNPEDYGRQPQLTPTAHLCARARAGYARVRPQCSPQSQQPGLEGQVSTPCTCRAMCSTCKHSDADLALSPAHARQPWLHATFKQTTPPACGMRHASPRGAPKHHLP